MNYKTLSIHFLAIILFICSCSGPKKARISAKSDQPTSDTSGLAAMCQSGEAIICIGSGYGKIFIKLYNETPLHRDNILKLIDKGHYDSLLFHRVIQGFMIQGGDPDSRKAAYGQKLGDGDVGYTIPAEFNQKLFHKRGVLAAAREGDDINPKKESSGCQFYITQGRGPLSDRDILLYEYRINKKLRNELKQNYLSKTENAPLREAYESYKKSGQTDSVLAIENRLDEAISADYQNSPHYTFSAEQIKAYKTVGGTPHLDGNYTVYGEVIRGMEVVDKIAAVDTDKNDRPSIDVRMWAKVIRRNK